MALQNVTIEQINDLLIDQIEAQLNKVIPILPKNAIRVITKIIAGTAIILYKVAGWIFLQIFVSTASFEEVEIFGKKLTPLIEWGRLIGTGDPDKATQAIISFDVTVNSIGSTLFSGTQFTSPLNGLTYITQQSYLLTTDPFMIEAICTTAGTQGNLLSGDPISLVNNLGIIEVDSIIDTLVTAAVDDENEESYRNKVIETFQLKPKGGALADYRIWSKDAAGVEQTYIYTGDDPADVLVYVAGDPDIYPDRIPDTALLLAVGNVIDFDPETGLATRRPLTAIIDPFGDKSYDNVKAIVLKSFDIEVTDLVISNISEISQQIKTALTNYFLERQPFIDGLSLPPKTNVISQANVISVVDDIVDSNGGTFTTAIVLLGGFVTPQYTLGEGEISKLLSLKVNGSPVT